MNLRRILRSKEAATISRGVPPLSQAFVGAAESSGVAECISDAGTVCACSGGSRLGLIGMREQFARRVIIADVVTNVVIASHLVFMVPLLFRCCRRRQQRR